MTDLSDRTTIVVGASRGLGHGVAAAFAEAGGPVVAVSRTAAAFPGLDVRGELADATDPAVAADLIGRHDPDTIVIVGGAVPHMAPLAEQTWESFSLAWEADVKMTFHWIREVLRTPMRAGGRVVVFSSGAALQGSPLSGGYAGAKGTQKFVVGYARDEARRNGLDVTFTTIMPQFAPSTAVGEAGVRAYAEQAGVTIPQFLSKLPPLLDPATAGSAIVELVKTDAADTRPTYLLNGAGLKALD